MRWKATAGGRRRRIFRLAVGAGALVGTLAVGGSPASAHAELVSTEPVAGSVDQMPARVVLRFTERVEVTPAAIRVFDSGAERADKGKADHPGGDSKAVGLKLPRLDGGVYVVTWRVTSADSHPIHGAFTFRVGPAVADDGGTALAKQLLSAGGGSQVVGGVYAVVRLLAYASLVVLVGGLAFLLLVWPAGAGVERARRALALAWVGATSATFVGIWVYGAYSGGLGIGAAFSPSVFLGALGIRFGRLWGARLILLLALAPLARMLLTRMSEGGKRPESPLPVVVGGLGVSLFLATAAVGHASTGSLAGLGVASNLLHLNAVSFWLGGLTLLSLCVLPRRQIPEISAVVPAFSRFAFWAVLVILATGTYQGFREVRTVAALTATPYGKLLILKVVLYTGMVGFGAMGRRWVRSRYRVPQLVLSPGPGTPAAEPEGATLKRLRRSVGAEAVLAAIVLAVTSVLVNMVPARSALAAPFSADIEGENLVVTVTVDPAKAGVPADLHFYTLAPSGSVAEVADMDAKLSLPAQDIGPLELPLSRVAPGHYSAYGFEIPIKGLWDLEVVARVSEIDQVTVKTKVPVR